MQYKDYYEILGVPKTASQDEIKQAYRKLARKYHPDVSKLADAEARFKEINEAQEVLKDPEKRAAYDQVGSGFKAGQDFQPPPNWDAGFEFRGGEAPGGGFGGAPFGGEGFDASDFFESLFGARSRGGNAGPRRRASMQGEDHHAKVLIDLEDAFRGAERSISLRVPKEGADGRVTLEERRLDVNIPKGIRPGQHLRLSGQGAPGSGGAPAGDLYLEIELKPHPRYRLDGADLYVDLPLAPWEAALGASVDAATPEGTVQLTIPKGSSAGRKLRLKGRGLPARGSGTAGDLYAVLTIALPPADSDKARDAYTAMASSFAGFDARRPRGG
jgi:curved DNA-binding protein